MLTHAQIQRLAQRNGIGAQVQERDYIQNLLLFLLYTRSQDMIFKGGTAVRIIYRGNRYSEDLEFDSFIDIEAIRSLWKSVVDKLLDFGVRPEIRRDWLSEFGYSFDISYQGPIYDGRDRTKGKVRVDNNLRQERIETRKQIATPEYDDLRPFVVTVLTAEHLLAEKVRAWLVRGLPRDLYDIWLITQHGVELRRSLIVEKLALYDIAFTKENVNEAMDTTKKKWGRDLPPLLPQFLEFDEIKDDIGEVFGKIAGRDM